MNTQKTLILAVVLAALAAAVFLWELPRQRAERDKDLAGDKVLDLDFEAVTAIELTRDHETLAFTKTEDDQWQMTKPVVDQTERWVVDSLVSAIRYAHPNRTISDLSGDALTRFGLDKPTVVVAYQTPEVTRRVRIGGTNPLDRARYVKPEDEQVVYLVGEASLSALEKPAGDFRRAALLAPVDTELKLSALRLERAGAEPVELVAAEPEKPAEDEAESVAPVLPEDMIWHLDGPSGPVVDRVIVKDLLDAVAGAKANGFLPLPGDDLASYGLAKPKMRVHATYGTGEAARTFSLAFGDQQLGASFYAMTEHRPYLFTVHQDKIRPFDKTRKDLRDHRLFGDLNASRVAIIDLQSPDASFRISRSADGWALADETPADAEAVADWLADILAWRAEELIDGRRARRLRRTVRGGQTVTLSLLDAEAKVLETVRFSKPIEPDVVAPVPKWKKAPTLVPMAPAADEKTTQRVALLTGGFADTVYLVDPALLDGMPRSVEELRAEENPAADTDEESETTDEQNPAT